MCTVNQRRKPDERRYLEFTPSFRHGFKQAEDFDFDSNKYIREFTGKMTKKRWKTLDHICRFYSRPFQYRCGHDWDCCGCVFAVSMSFTYRKNQVSIYLTYHRNY